MGWLRQNNGAGQRRRPSRRRADPRHLQRRHGEVGAVRPEQRLPQPPHPDASGGDALALEPKPELGQGPHFFYALQWWFFALLATVGYFWFAWAEAKERRNPTRIDGFATTGPGDL